MEQIPTIDRIKQLVRECNYMPRRSIEQLYTVNDNGTTAMNEIVSRLKEIIELMAKEQGVSINPGVVMFIIISNLGKLQDSFLEGQGLEYYFSEHSESNINTIRIKCGSTTRDVFNVKINEKGELHVDSTLNHVFDINYDCERDTPNEIGIDCSEPLDVDSGTYRQDSNIWIEFDEHGLWNSCSHILDFLKKVQGKSERQTIAYKYNIQDGNITMGALDDYMVEGETQSPLPEYEPRRADVMSLIYPPIDSETFGLQENIPYIDILGTVFREIYDQAVALHKSYRNK